MGVSSYFEFVVTLFGWVMYDNLWSVLSGSGIVYIPFLVMIASNIIQSRKAGDDEGSAGVQSLKKIETDLVVMIIVMMLACIPLVDVELGEMRYTKPALDCQLVASTIDGDDTGTTYDSTLATLGGQTGRIPAWWGFMHIVSKAVVSASIASIPCSYDLASVEAKLANDNIEDPRLRKELQEFINDCYMPSKSKLIRTQTGALSSAQLKEANWVGSSYFLNTTGYYNTYYANSAKPDWTYIASRDAGFEADQSVGGHPQCSDWWSNGSTGVRARLLDSIENDLIDGMIYDANNLMDFVTGSTLTTTEKEDLFLRKYIDITTTKATYTGSTGDLSVSYSVGPQERFEAAANDGFMGGIAGMVSGSLSQVSSMTTTAMAAIGSAISLPSALAEGEMIREGVSIVQGLLMMMVILLLPFLQVLGLYKPSVVLTLSVIYFSIHFFSFIWAIAFWVDNNLMGALLEGGTFTVIANPTQSMIILWVQRLLYIVFPMIFMTSMGWVGFNFGKLGSEMTQITNAASSPGAAGGDVVAKAATKGKA